MKRKIWLNCLLLILIAGATACKKNAVEELEPAQTEQKAQTLAALANQATLLQAPIVPYDVDPENDTKEGAKTLQWGQTYSASLTSKADVDYYRLKNPTCLQKVGFELTGNKNINVALAFEDGSWMPIKGQSHITIIGPTKKVWVRVSHNINADLDPNDSGYKIKSTYYGK